MNRLARSSSIRAVPPTRSRTPSSSIHVVDAPVLARRLSWWTTGVTEVVVTGGVVTGGVVIFDVVVVVTGGVVVVPDVVVEVGGVVVEDVVESVVEVVVDVVVEVDVGGVVVVVVDSVVVVVTGGVVVVVEVVVHGVVVVVVGVVVVDVGGSSPLGDGTRQSGRSFGHHAAAHTWPSPEAEASGAAPCSETTVNTAPAVSTPI
ncbi:hypothetical protein DFR72_102749 [Lentzea flaviverrucosa]|uniref:Uncharacterized protein n=1 Tax=Lentzea flaviverrucosa TaxID=200379 RepID=A0A1H9TRH9_9PSEU|nr:hypothetical protein DFR72_102749 [Lentzea flaviverrucosa]SER99795.1 hypothetical protein SAMN05216195_108107 [Lentzea flaviverrucosa]